MHTRGGSMFPSTKGCLPFQFKDGAELTIIGVVMACAGWPVVTRVSSSPRWLVLRTAIGVTLVLWLPDLDILAKGQSARAVGVVMVLHLAVAPVGYNALVRMAPARRRARGGAAG